MSLTEEYVHTCDAVHVNFKYVVSLLCLLLRQLSFILHKTVIFLDTYAFPYYLFILSFAILGVFPDRTYYRKRAGTDCTLLKLGMKGEAGIPAVEAIKKGMPYRLKNSSFAR
jgi:hypothetical protein